MKWLVSIVLALAALTLAGLALIVMVIVDSDASAAEDSTGKQGGAGLRNIPAEYHPWLTKADAACPHPEMTPAFLASQLYQESRFNAAAVSPAGAKGPAQFIDGTWATWGRDYDGNGEISRSDIGDSVMAQGALMCSLLRQAKSSGYPGDPRALALAGYNAGWGRVEEFRGVPPRSFARGETYNYVRIILDKIPYFEGPDPIAVSGNGIGADALRRAVARMGTPYSWGGGGPGGPSTGFCDGTNGYLRGKCSASSTVGFDCSSLVQYSYWPTTKLPRVAAAQYGETSHRPVARDQLQPGDLLFWSHGGSGAIYHVAIYAGDGKVVHAPRTGRVVEVQPLTAAMPARDYYGATRP
ncbi:transglycosylase [Streptomyces omiyaensis]|uniref:C40 family peptidase n=1 Tax=Streptomyces omiyaensis TaxID=68247 RepID=UPI00167B3FC3|nr:bifunctional lytic transglycosylase/C40 family peptidase [Streptomyces omiyaensis]GGY71163.1 transglycosylase [Streptomyces omiyaensis]